MADIHPNDIGLATAEDVGDVALLATRNKEIVAAINELKESGGGTQVYTEGANNTILGEGNVVYGNDNLVIGNGNVILGDKQAVIGNDKNFYQWPSNLGFDWCDIYNNKVYFYISEEPYEFTIKVGDKIIIRTYISHADENWENYFERQTPLYAATVTSIDTNNYMVTVDQIQIPEGTVPPQYIYLDGEYVSVYAILRNDFKVTTGNYGISTGNRAEGARSFTANAGTAKGTYAFAANGGIAENYVSFAANHGRVYADYAAAFNQGYAYSNYATALNQGYSYNFCGLAVNNGVTLGRGIKCTSVNFTSRYATAATGENVSSLVGTKIYLRYRYSTSYYTSTVTVTSVSGQNICWNEIVGSSSYGLMPDGYIFRIENSYGAAFAHGRGLAGGMYAKASGNYTVSAHEGAEVCGKFGVSPDAYSWSLANGTSIAAQGLAVKMLQSGDVYADGTFSSPCADYAELFEWKDGNAKNEDRAGLFVTLEGNKIKPAGDFEEFVLGVISANPAIIGDTGELRWSGKFMTDDFGRVIYQDVTIPAEYDADGNLIKEEAVENQPVINPAWDSSEEYIPRSERPEWSAVGVIGKLRVRDDGTCKPGDLCRPTNGGIATKSIQNGYKVLKRISNNVILVWVR